MSVMPMRREDDADTDEVERREIEEQGRALAALFDSWLNVDEEGKREQEETLAFLRVALNEDRLSDRLRFR